MPQPTPFQPTPEQQAIREAFTTGQHLVIQAGAGTGKTSTLRMLACDQPHRRGAYLAYNRAIATDAAASFPSSVHCATAHSFAFRAVGRRYAHRLNAPRQTARHAAQTLGITRPLALDAGVTTTPVAPIAPQQLARITLETIARFCHCADPDLTARHVPRPTGLEAPDAHAALAAAVLPHAQRAWADLTHPGGRLKFAHDVYLKIWQLSKPRLPVDYVLLDEAQDADPVIAAIVDTQTHAQRILVGDPCQAIYGWRGAIDAMTRFHGRRLTLARSFRFGPAIAAEANKWLTPLHAPLRLTGHPPIRSRIEPAPCATAILCRTNAGALREAMHARTRGRRAALVGGAHHLRRFAEAAVQLKAGIPCEHPELFLFQTWSQLQDYVAHEESGRDLKTMVKLIDDFGPDTILHEAGRLTDESTAQVVISTAHKAKGREWDVVRVADDFGEPQRDNNTITLPASGELMLNYVTVTRARQILDPGPLNWINETTTT